MNQFLDKQFWGNSVYSWLLTTGTLIGLIIAIKIIGKITVRKIRGWSLKTNTQWDDFLVDTIERFLIPIVYTVGLYSASHLLMIPQKVQHFIHVVYLCILTFLVLRIISSAFRKLVSVFIDKHENAAGKMQQARGLIIIANVIIWVIGIIFLVDNLGYNVTTLLAGLGIGGIAIALAAQAILGDLFSYFVIFFDRPFEVGDFITVDNKSGTIEQIGIKTTRIRTLGGEQLVCSNTDLTNSRLHNFKRLEHRRIVFSLGVTYQTPSEILAGIPDIVQDIIDRTEQADYERGNLAAFADSSINFEFVYHVLTDDYATYMRIQETILLNIFKVFEKHRIEFAYPTQTLYMQPA